MTKKAPKTQKSNDKREIIDFMKNKSIALFVSFVLIISSLYLVFTKGLNLGVDFTGGIVIELRTEKKSDKADLRDFLNSKKEELNVNEFTLQNIGEENDIMIRVSNNSKNNDERIKFIENVKILLKEKLGENTKFRKVDYVGPQIGEELKKDGAMALGFAFIGMLIYIWMRFEFQFGVGAILALIHDAILTLGIYSFLQLEFNVTSIAAILTIIGYSINDSVVIYDRIRENLRKYKKKPLTEVLNLSINDTLSRTILTAGTTLVAILALIIVGGDAIFGLSVAVFAGVIIGTYSSIYIAAPILTLIKSK